MKDGVQQTLFVVEKFLPLVGLKSRLLAVRPVFSPLSY